VVSLYDFEYDNIWTEVPQDYTNFLYCNYFFVREDFDENKVIDDFKARFTKYIAPTYLDRPNHYTILTTTKCNARCPYCYELAIANKHDMTEKTARDIVKYIVDNAEPDRPITFEWFGGEPMTNSRVIDIITSGVCSAGMDATSSMITNGYLFNDDFIARAVNIWKLTNV
jgi:sulfatase maturation enzyme AslB (radical SAM superfamily)